MGGSRANDRMLVSGRQSRTRDPRTSRPWSAASAFLKHGPSRARVRWLAASGAVSRASGLRCRPGLAAVSASASLSPVVAMALGGWDGFGRPRGHARDGWWVRSLVGAGREWRPPLAACPHGSWLGTQAPTFAHVAAKGLGGRSVSF
jgi:hypothetical protein